MTFCGISSGGRAAASGDSFTSGKQITPAGGFGAREFDQKLTGLGQVSLSTILCGVYW